jgi:SAM-dependent methyltransferase
MNTQALFFILLALLWGVWPAWGQGVRSSVGAGPSVGNSAAIGTSAGYSRQGSTAVQSHFRSGSYQSGQMSGAQRSGQQSRIRHAPIPPSPPHSSGWPSQDWRRFPRFSSQTKPHHPHFQRHDRHHHFPKHRGILIIEVPTVVGTVVETNGIRGTGVTNYNPLPYPGGVSERSSSEHLAPFDPTPQEVVERMLELAGVTKSDTVYDLGAGDGRIVIAAAKKYGAKAVGFEIDPGLVKLARENVRKAGVEKLVEIRQEDFMTADLSAASVVTLYLSFDGNIRVRPLLMRQLEPGARVVSYHFDMGDWQPKIVESYRDSGGDAHTLYFWQISGPLIFSDSAQ